ncbi:uncharacterized protein [Elaeis guineensis]|uniref:Uncharacterized protein LOC105059422 isoform X2 n=1 Tax=Elaeis guineensis var. tenera TaxID=51953 RepID=A0A8N4EWZ9_ELAGV|nr:uncharacterized protein LOC105059422 isoform X2 [Elaeis guineensis]
MALLPANWAKTKARPFDKALTSSFEDILKLMHDVVQIGEIVVGLGWVKGKLERDLQAMEVRRKASEEEASKAQSELQVARERIVQLERFLAVEHGLRAVQ